MSRVGLYTWPDGTRYEGEWREHTRDGFGVHTYADGTRYEVRFSRHRLFWQDSEHICMCSTWRPAGRVSEGIDARCGPRATAPASRGLLETGLGVCQDLAFLPRQLMGGGMREGGSTMLQVVSASK